MTETKRPWLDRPIIESIPQITVEVLVFTVIIVLAVLSRFYDLGTRVMSHDESLHTYFSWQLYKGQGYQHNPMMHGPFQFHFLALSYFLFGVSDFTARIPAALLSILTVGMIWYWRHYLGRVGALAAAAMALISPYLLYYGRYTRNESFIGLFGLVMLYAMLRYFELGDKKYLYWLTAALVLHFASKETAFIYAAQALLFLFFYFILSVTKTVWEDDRAYRTFILCLIAALLLLGAGAGYSIYESKNAPPTGAETLAPANPTDPTSLPESPVTTDNPIPMILIGLGILVIAAAGYFLVTGFTLERILGERSFDMLILISTLILPMLTALPVKLLGWNPMDYSPTGLLYTGGVLLPILLISIAIGYLWGRDTWIKCAVIFYAIFVVLYTTVFTNGQGFFTGLIGSLGYWLEQQPVQRGSQPWYFYLLIQIPMYEYLPALASIFAGILALRLKKNNITLEDGETNNRSNTLALLGWWSISSLIAYTLAGEKMPWLTFHIALPMVLLGGWGIGKLVEKINWEELKENNPLIVLSLSIIFVLSAFGVVLSWFGNPAPFQGKELAQLQTTASFVLAVICMLASGFGLNYYLSKWTFSQTLQLTTLAFFGILAGLTVHTTILTNYINYDSGKEYLVYAHSYTGVKDVLRQVDEVSEALTGGNAVVVAYDDDVPWPFSWYLRDYPNARFYGNAPTKDLREAPLIIVGDNNFGKIEPIVGEAYYRFDYVRMVWPNQDYFNLTQDRVKSAITDPAIRAGIFDIWLNHDFTRYAKATGDRTDFTNENWSPSDRMRLYIRKDVAAQIWDYGVGPAPSQVQADPYEKGIVTLNAVTVFGNTGDADGQFASPRGVAVAPDGSVYVADSRHHRIQHFSANGQFINAWGTFGDNSLQAAANGQFNEPWGIAVGPDGSVYVSDTWNHRIQKFTADGVPLLTWGRYGQGETPDAFWGPRGIEVDAQGKVYIADTGNKRIVVFDSNGNYIAQFGQVGIEAGQFDEPVDMAVDAIGNVYVTDTWNQRVQVFAPSPDGLTYAPIAQWDVAAWYGQSLDNKPYITVDSLGHVYISDPEGFRVIEFTTQGKFIRLWGTYGSGNDSFGLLSGIATDANGNVWVVDAGNNRIMKFTTP